MLAHQILSFQFRVHLWAPDGGGVGIQSAAPIGLKTPWIHWPTGHLAPEMYAMYAGMYAISLEPPEYKYCGKNSAALNP